MAQPPRDAQWRFDREAQQDYYYDPQDRSYVFRDGRRVPASSRAPRSFPDSASATHPPLPAPPPLSGPNTSYTYGVGTQQPSYAYGVGAQQPSNANMPFPPGREQQAQDLRPQQASVEPVAQDFARMGLQDQQSPQPASTEIQSFTPRVWEDNRGRFVDVQNPNTDVRTILRTGPANLITDPALLPYNIKAYRMLYGTEGEVEKLFKEFRKREKPKAFFTVGKVFKVLWVEPAGESNTIVTGLEPGTSVGRFGERVFSKVRRFVVVREGDTYCSALPIASYGRRGVSKPGVKKSEHGIIHTGRQAPNPLPAEAPQRGEMPMRLEPIRVNPDNPTEKLDDVSRIDYGKVHTVQHNVKVQSFGQVHPRSMNALTHQFFNVWTDSGQTETSTESTAVAGPSRPRERSDGTALAHRDSRSAGRPSSYSIGSRNSGGSLGKNSGGGDWQRHHPSKEAVRASQAQAAVNRLIQSGRSPEEAFQMVRQVEVGEHRDNSDEDEDEVEDEDEGEDEDEDEESEPVQQSGARSGGSGPPQLPRVPPSGNARNPNSLQTSVQHPYQVRNPTAPPQGPRQASSSQQQQQPQGWTQPRVSPPQPISAQAPTQAQQTEAAISQLRARGYSREQAIQYLADQRRRVSKS